MSTRSVCVSVLGLALATTAPTAWGLARVWVADQGNNQGSNNRIIEIDPVNKKTPPDADGTDIIILNTLPSPAGCFLDELDFDSNSRIWAVVKNDCDQNIDGARRIDKETGAVDIPPGLITPQFPGASRGGILEGLAWDGTGLWISAVRDGLTGNMLTRVSPATGAQIAPFTTAPLAGGKCNIPGTICQGLLWEPGNNGYGWLWHTDVGVNKIYKLDISRLFTNPSYNPNDANALTVAEFSVPFQPKGLSWMGSKIWVGVPRGSTGGIWEFDPSTGATTQLFHSPNWHLDGVAILSGPFISLNKTSITTSVWLGDGNPVNDTFTVANGDGGTLTYSIADDGSWLTVTPPSGSSTGTPNTHTVSYDVSGRSAGTYTATITVSGNANPAAIAVSMTIRTVKPDLDGDGDVDQGDFGLFQTCYTVPGGQPEGACAAADFNGDHTVSSLDFDVFMACMSGPGVPAVRTCAGS
jgi:hypothetical protein